ncbi:conserved hypothetical protein [Trichinella spiralis]|uniref:hypothetical protein n=1 Tax=Trichinella spiralis TaxID=6334 RepID=UPI0001EFB515|nr:conserved hypothetical protein [Trichinella spiralis]
MGHVGFVSSLARRFNPSIFTSASFWTPPIYECRVYQRKQILKVNSEFANGCAPHADNCTPDSSILSKIEIKNNLKRCAAEETILLLISRLELISSNKKNKFIKIYGTALTFEI